MTISNGYCTLADVKADKMITSTNATDDAFIESLVEAASRFIDNRTQRMFYTSSADETRYFTAEYADLVVPGDLVSITTLKTDNNNDRVYENTWATTDYDLLPSNAVFASRPYTSITRAPNGVYTFPSRQRSVQIVGKFGWSAAPATIKMACIEIVVNIYNNRFGNNNTGAAVITGAGVVITPKDIPASALMLIDGERILY